MSWGKIQNHYIMRNFLKLLLKKFCFDDFHAKEITLKKSQRLVVNLLIIYISTNRCLHQSKMQILLMNQFQNFGQYYYWIYLIIKINIIHLWDLLIFAFFLKLFFLLDLTHLIYEDLVLALSFERAFFPFQCLFFFGICYTL